MIVLLLAMVANSSCRSRRPRADDLEPGDRGVSLFLLHDLSRIVTGRDNYVMGPLGST